jgi:hypothetical protein
MSRYVLVTITTCHKCPAVKRALLNAGLDMRVINEKDEIEFPELVSKYGLQSAPALIDLEAKKVVNYEEFLLNNK